MSQPVSQPPNPYLAPSSDDPPTWRTTTTAPMTDMQRAAYSSLGTTAWVAGIVQIIANLVAFRMDALTIVVCLVGLSLGAMFSLGGAALRAATTEGNASWEGVVTGFVHIGRGFLTYAIVAIVLLAPLVLLLSFALVASVFGTVSG